MLHKILIFTIILLSFCLVGFIVLDRIGIIDKINNIQTIVDFISSLGVFGGLFFIALTVANVIFLPIPAPVMALVGALLFGSILSFIYLSIGTLVGSIAMFTLGKIFGRKLSVWMIGEDKTKKYSELINKKGKIFLLLAMIFPFFPDDILCLIAGISSMNYLFFIFVICMTRIVVIAFMCFFASGDIIPFSGWGIPVWIVLIILAVFIFITISIKHHNNQKHLKINKIDK